MTNWRWLVALAIAGAGCSGGADTQVLEGHLTGSGAVVRAVQGGSVIAAAQVKGDGTWTMALPKGDSYRLEVLTNDGVVHPVVARDTAGGSKALSFSVCEPVDPYDCGGMGDPSGGGTGSGSGSGMGCDPSTDPGCKCDPNGNCWSPPPPCDPTTDPNCPPPPPPACDPTTDPTCTCDAAGNCYCTDPNDPNCKPPPPMCDPNTDPTCGCDAAGNCPPPPPPKCDPTTDPICVCDAAGNCWDDPCKDPSDPNCMPPVCPNPDPSGACPPACTDPNDPTTCKDPCMIDPMSCGCASDDPNCWPPPCDPKSDPMCGDPSGGSMAPDHPPGDFGCKGSG